MIEDNRTYYVVEFASGAAANTFTSAIQFNAKYCKMDFRRQTMASVCTIYPQVGLTNASGSFFRVLNAQNNYDNVIASSVTTVITLGTNVSGYWIDGQCLANFPYLRFECASLPTDAVQMHVIVGRKEY